jgi:hypothetical protein
MIRLPETADGIALRIRPEASGAGSVSVHLPRGGLRPSERAKLGTHECSESDPAPAAEDTAAAAA